MFDRAAGILAHVTSLPGPFGIGDFGSGVETFLRFLTDAGQSLWHVMPLGPTGYHNSPYAALSAFAGNPLLISPERLVEDGFLSRSALEGAPAFPEDHVDFEKVSSWREGLLRKASERFAARGNAAAREAFATFVEAPEQKIWLDDFALFAALARRAQTTDATAWDRDLALREDAALARARSELADEVRFHEFVQFLFFSQWEKVRKAAHEKNVSIVGDLPIYPAFGSADVWANPALFELDEEGKPTAVAGVPPDYFSATGQLWGNPLYRWSVHEEDGFAWWIERMRREERLCDRIRLDHFRAFAAYYSVPAGDETAARGHWVDGPGTKLFDALKNALGELPLVAEDLGFITPEVHELRDAIGFPGTRVLQFGFDEIDNEHLPHRVPKNSVYYTGTHDNDTARGWFPAMSDWARQNARDYLATDGHEIEWDLIRAVYESIADTAFVPLQDVLGLGSEARMNTPGVAHDNWAWRVSADALTPERAGRLRRLAELSGRLRKKT